MHHSLWSLEVTISHIYHKNRTFHPVFLSMSPYSLENAASYIVIYRQTSRRATNNTCTVRASPQGSQSLPTILDDQQFWTFAFDKRDELALLLTLFAKILYLSCLEWSFCCKNLSEILLIAVLVEIIAHECQIRRLANLREMWCVVLCNLVKVCKNDVYMMAEESVVVVFLQNLP